MQAPEDRRIAHIHAASKPAIERLLQQFGFIHLREHFRDGVACDSACDAERLYLANDTCAAAMLDAHFGSSAGNRRTAIVNRPLSDQAGHRSVDVVRFEFPAGEPLADLGFGEFAAGEERQARDVRPVGAIGHQRVPGLSGARFSVISIAVPQGSRT